MVESAQNERVFKTTIKKIYSMPLNMKNRFVKIKRHSLIQEHKDK